MLVTLRCVCVSIVKKKWISVSFFSLSRLIQVFVCVINVGTIGLPNCATQNQTHIYVLALVRVLSKCIFNTNINIYFQSGGRATDKNRLQT